MKTVSSPIKYPGGKSFLSFKMVQIWKNYTDYRWCDLFCGSLALPLVLKPRTAILNDANPDLISFWKWIQSNPKISLEMRHEEEFYYALRAKFNGEQFTSEERGQAFYYLNRTCYNGLVRYSKRGFNTPFGSYKKIDYEQDFSRWQSAIAGWEFSCADFREVIKGLDGRSFIYSDPPYYKTFSNYYGNFTWKDHVDLATLLSKHDGPVVASNSYTPEIILLYSDLGFEIEVIDAPRKISRDAEGRKDVQEILAFKNLPRETN
jgi:DNA adenine methylase